MDYSFLRNVVKNSEPYGQETWYVGSVTSFHLSWTENTIMRSICQVNVHRSVFIKMFNLFFFRLFVRSKMTYMSFNPYRLLGFTIQHACYMYYIHTLLYDFTLKATISLNLMFPTILLGRKISKKRGFQWSFMPSFLPFSFTQMWIHRGPLRRKTRPHNKRIIKQLTLCRLCIDAHC